MILVMQLLLAKTNKQTKEHNNNKPQNHPEVEFQRQVPILTTRWQQNSSQGCTQQAPGGEMLASPAGNLMVFF